MTTNKMMPIVWNFSKVRHLLNEATAKLYYTSPIRPLLEYAAATLYNMSGTNAQKIWNELPNAFKTVKDINGFKNSIRKITTTCNYKLHVVYNTHPIESTCSCLTISSLLSLVNSFHLS